MNKVGENNFLSKYINRLYENSAFRFAFLWLFVFTLYLPAAKAGFVADFSGWLELARTHGFIDNLNRKGFGGQSLYQFTQLNTWICYKLFGTHEWLWHLLFITLHVINCSLFYQLVVALSERVHIANVKRTALIGVLLFSVSPYLCETIVWEPSFHFLQGLLLILLILNLAVNFINTGYKKYAIYAGIIYLLSTFSLEVFYITPWLVMALAVYYKLSGSKGGVHFRHLAVCFFMPMIILFLFHLLLFRMVYGGWVAHIGTGTVTGLQLADFSKPVKYLFHLLFLGRFFPHDTKPHIYYWCSTKACVFIFYSLSLITVGLWIVYFKKLSARIRFAGLLWVCLLICLAILIPLWFQEEELSTFDRYLYFAASFFYMLVAFLIGGVTLTFLRVALLLLYSLVNLRFTILLTRYWGKSARVISGLFHDIPYTRGKPVLLLNIPQNMHGVAMIGAEKTSEFKLLHDLLLPYQKITETVYDCMAYNMTTPNDGAHVKVLNESTIMVTLNQYGTWWFFATRGGVNYENEAYSIELTNEGNTGLSYYLKLKKPATNYTLLYSVSGKWKVVDMNNRNTDQK